MSKKLLVVIAIFITTILPKNYVHASYVGITIGSGATGFAMGGALAAMIVDRQKTNFTPTVILWGSVGCIGSLIAALLITNQSSEIKELEMKNETLRKELDSIKGISTGGNLVPKLTGSLPINFQQNLPEKFKKLVKPAEWHTYKIEEWTQVDDTHLRGPHEIMELIPAALNAETNEIVKGE